MDARRGLLGWVLVALLGAQLLGLLHRVAHAPLAAPPASQQRAGEPSPQGGVAALFPTHDAPECRLFDAVGPDNACPPPAGSTPALLASEPPSGHVPQVLARWVAPFQARGPPSR